MELYCFKDPDELHVNTVSQYSTIAYVHVPAVCKTRILQKCVQLGKENHEIKSKEDNAGNITSSTNEPNLKKKQEKQNV